jgi:hypothetical protein
MKSLAHFLKPLPRAIFNGFLFNQKRAYFLLKNFRNTLIIIIFALVLTFKAISYSSLKCALFSYPIFKKYGV